MACWQRYRWYLEKHATQMAIHVSWRLTLALHMMPLTLASTTQLLKIGSYVSRQSCGVMRALKWKRSMPFQFSRS